MRVHAVAAHDGFTLDARIEAEPGSTVAILGPNGAGKSTLLRVVAGLAGPGAAASAVRVDDETWAGDGRVLEPRERSVGYVAAEPLLFPHLSVLDNVAFGPRARGASRAEAQSAARDELERLGVAEFERRRPSELSTGQAQRVALARALATAPRVLLLDEPLSALDPATRTETRSALANRLASFDGVALFVTHDPLDALTLADRLVFLEAGRVVQDGAPADVIAKPRSPYVADIVGLNLYRGTTDGGTRVATEFGDLITLGHDHTGPSWVSFDPRAVSLFDSRPEGSPRNGWPLTVAGVDLAGQTARVRLTGSIDLRAEVTATSVASMGLAPGREVWASVKATEVHAYPV